MVKNNTLYLLIVLFMFAGFYGWLIVSSELLYVSLLIGILLFAYRILRGDD